ncbi:unnamed protein product [Prorocentrum cordatum]|uniref:Uncharacterized protein n=1 Tax=Prorocentrum cordatum TaxID=2364126 RepID=A0ABN9XLS7_9DINO|nr:unnamed protein product [Polarella glacialis]
MPVTSEQVEEWADEIWEGLGKDPSWSIAEVRCKEEGCPPVETVITDLNTKKPVPGRGVYKIFKAIAEVTQEDVKQVLTTQEAAGGHGHGGGHGGGHADSGHAAHSGDCCKEGHGGHEGHKGHDGHGGGHGDGGHAAHSGDCCEGGHGGHEGHADAGHGGHGGHS